MIQSGATREPLSLVEWAVSDRLIDYEDALQFMTDRAAAIRAGKARELVWLLEHPPLYTAGTSAKAEHLLNAALPVFAAGRGGDYTYHGPGQRVIYIMLDLKQRGQDVRAFVSKLERWIIAALASFGIKGYAVPGRPGVWVRLRPYPGSEEAKIAALGLRIRNWVTTHGISLNVDPNLSHYDGIVPCGLHNLAVTSLTGLGLPVTLADADMALKSAFEDTFGPTNRVKAPAIGAAYATAAGRAGIAKNKGA